MIDPKAYKHRSRRPADTCIPVVDVAEVIAIGLELGPLRELPWAPLAERVEALAAALRGGEGVGPGLLHQLRRWAATWAHLRPELRAFYLRHADHPAGEAAVWRILEGGVMRGPLRGQLERLWLEDHGTPAAYSIVPACTLPAVTPHPTATTTRDTT